MRRLPAAVYSSCMSSSSTSELWSSHAVCAGSRHKESSCQRLYVCAWNACGHIKIPQLWSAKGASCHLAHREVYLRFALSRVIEATDRSSVAEGYPEAILAIDGHAIRNSCIL